MRTPYSTSMPAFTPRDSPVRPVPHFEGRVEPLDAALLLHPPVKADAVDGAATSAAMTKITNSSQVPGFIGGSQLYTDPTSRYWQWFETHVCPLGQVPQSLVS